MSIKNVANKEGKYTFSELLLKIYKNNLWKIFKKIPLILEQTDSFISTAFYNTKPVILSALLELSLRFIYFVVGG